MSIVRVGLTNQKFSDGYDAIFGNKKKLSVKVKKAKPKSKKSGKKKK